MKSKLPKQFNLNKWWKKALAGLGIVAMLWLGLTALAAGIIYILTSFLVTVFADPGSAVFTLIIYGFVVYGCYRGIRRLGRDWNKSRRKKK